MPVLTAEPEVSGWRGRIEARFVREAGRTVLKTARAHMPLALQRPFYPEGAQLCHVLILHPPGGLVGGDRLEVNLELETGAQALLTTPAAGKWYRCVAGSAQQIFFARAAREAHIEWLPQESIVFDGAMAHQMTRVELASGATWLGWDITRFGRSARGERFTHGEWRARTEVWRDGEPLWIDRQQLSGGSRLMQSAYGLSGQPVVGVLAWLGAAVTPELVGAARGSWVDGAFPGEAGVTRLPDGLVCRYRGPSSGAARKWFTAVWDLLRREFRGRVACPPRIWNT